MNVFTKFKKKNIAGLLQYSFGGGPSIDSNVIELVFTNSKALL